MPVTVEATTAPVMVGKAVNVNYRHQNVQRKTEQLRCVGFSSSLFDCKGHYLDLGCKEFLARKFLLGDKDGLLKDYYSARSDNEKKGTLRPLRRK